MDTPVSWVLPAFDVALAATLVFFAAALLTTPDLFKAIVIFIVFGLLMAITWGRLDAVDIALAEAAIGAGLTGALLMNAHGDLEARERRERRRGHGDEHSAEHSAAPDAPGTPDGHRPEQRSLRLHIGAAILALSTAAVLAWAVLSVPARHEGMRPLALANLEPAGVDNPVTAVLLSFRAYDTLLEIAVLLLAAIAAWSQRLTASVLEIPKPGLVLLATVRLLVPITVLIGGYLLWLGTDAPGGAFQAGAVLAGAGVMLLLAERPLPARWRHTPLRLGLAIGVIVFLTIGVAGELLAPRFLYYRGEHAATLILLIELTATVSIALILIALFAGQPPTAGATRSAGDRP